jgi:hypothetical protein
MQKICILLMFPVLFVPLVHAQKSGDVGILGGITYYVGDLNPAIQFRKSKPAFGLMYRQNINSRISVRAHGLYGSVEADDAYKNANPDRNLNFESKIYEAGLQLEINFFEFFIGSKLHPVSPYIFGGASVFFFKPYGNVAGEKTELRPLLTEGQDKAYNSYAFAIPFGIGVKYSVNSLIGVGAEWGMRKTTTDYLDDVSTTYYFDGPTTSNPTIKELASDPLLTHTTEMQRGNSRNTDWYSFAGVSVTFKIRMLKGESCLDHQREGY